ncbi:MAG: mercuric transport protein [Rubrivivax sp. SCN 70-15]|nr:MAG: mercuric transport protein [Rubrivivax sp. SCN 70-15]
MSCPDPDAAPDPGRQTAGGRLALLAGGVAALLASSCCLGPLVLLLLGFSGAWIGNLSRLEPLRPWFIAVALVALGWAGRRIWRPVADCAPGRVCALPGVRRGYRWAFAIVALLVLVALAFPFLAPLFY